MDGVEAGWHPDPEGRHELRYWNGVDWTDHVSDRGVTSVDPLTPITVTPTAAPPPWATGASPAAPVWNATAASPTPKKKPWGLISLGVIVAAAVAVGLIVFVGGDGDGGGNPFRTYDLAIDEDNPLVAVRLDLESGQAFRFRAIPDSADLDLIVSIVADEETALRSTELGLFTEEFTEVSDAVEAGDLSDFFTDGANAFSDYDGLETIGFEDDDWWEFERTDFAGSGGGEGSAFAAPSAGNYLLVVGPGFDGGFGSFELTLEEYGERFDFEADQSDLDQQFSDGLDFLTDEDFFSDIDFTD